MARSNEQVLVIEEFDEVVNITRKELQKWIETDESKSVGQGEGESKGHESGRKIVEILDKKKSDYYDDIDHMRKVVGYVNRHQAQKPECDVEGSNWRYSLLSWGHDPLKWLPTHFDRRSRDPCLELAEGGVIARRYLRPSAALPADSSSTLATDD